MSARRTMPLIAAEVIRGRVYHHDGQFIRLPRPLCDFANEYEHAKWNRNFAATPLALKLHSNGYQSVRIDSQTIMAHRLAWVLHYGAWPKGELDHINGDKLDNRIENLRDGNKSENMRNQHVRSDSTSGFPGVHFCKHKKSRPWVARIGMKGTWKTVGYFATREEAIECRKREQVKYGFSERHGCPREAAA